MVLVFFLLLLFYIHLENGHSMGVKNYLIMGLSFMIFKTLYGEAVVGLFSPLIFLS